MTKAELVIIGGGPAGLAAALSAWESGVRDILILERDHQAGGILNQCIHNGFGLHYFKEELTGPEYAGRFIEMLRDTDVRVRTDTMVLDLTADRVLHTVSPEHGYEAIQAGAIVLAMGCRERTRGAISIPGARCSGIFTAGAAQRFLNIEGYMVGKRVVILGSGDIGLIMARRMTLEGAKVLACVELMPYSSGLNRNIVQCLEDYDIPLYLNHTVVDIEGRERLSGVVVARVDENRRPVPGSEIHFDCDTLLLSVGLIPENELSAAAGVRMSPVTSGPEVDDHLQTSVPGIYACGNVLHVHDLVDFVSEESALAGHAAAAGIRETGTLVKVLDGNGVRGVVPQQVRLGEEPREVRLMFRPAGVYRGACAVARCNGREIARKKALIFTPGEMAVLPLSRETVAAIDGDVTVEMEGI